MAIDINELLKIAQKEDAKNTPAQTVEVTKPEYQILYPHAVGTIEFRLLPNNKTNTVQRLVTRHKIPDNSVQWGSKNIACLNAHYGKDCPICMAIKNAQTVNGKECDAFKKYGYKSRGIAFAHIVNIGSEYDKVKPGDTVILQYPKSVYNEITKIILENAQNLAYILNGNEGCTFVIETLKAPTGFPDYKVKLNFGFNGPVMAKVKDTQEEYEAFLETLPSLNEIIVPSEEPENLYNEALAAADFINTTYGCVSEEVSTATNTNGNTIADSFGANNSSAPSGWVMPNNNTSSVNPTSSGNGQPACFGHHDDSNMKCSMCPHEMECLGIC